MWKESAIRILIGISGLAAGALFVLMLQGAAQADAERLQIAHDRANAFAAASANTVPDEPDMQAVPTAM